MNDIYKDSFEKFLSHTDEKEILLKEIVRDIDKIGANSLLDIGAGNGLLSIPLSKHVKDYLAIEPKESFIKKLTEAGLQTINTDFPTEVNNQFDMVLSSHSISYIKSIFEPFVCEAWNLVKPGGVFLVITYRGQEDDWTEFMRSLGENPIDRNRVSYNTLIMLLNSLGEVKTRKVTTTVKTENIEDMFYSLSFVASDGHIEKQERFMQKSERIVKTLESKYRDGSGFSFPFQHHFISTHKGTSIFEKNKSRISSAKWS